jgi:dienelactone hydrolase
MTPSNNQGYRMLLRLFFCFSSYFLLALYGTAAHGADPQGEALTIKAADGLMLSAKYYQSARPKALILLFHQAGSNYAEYATIAPRLVKEGYSALAIDQRSGGSMFQRTNETAKRFGKKAQYLEAEQDLEAALIWARDQKLPIAVWGSSYSSSLVFLLASKHPEDIKTVLSFSPGEYLGTPELVRTAAAKVSLPIYVTSSIETDEISAAETILKAAPSKLKTQFVPKIGGVHGSSTLREDRNPTGAAENWTAVLAFLSGVFK